MAARTGGDHGRLAMLGAMLLVAVTLALALDVRSPQVPLLVAPAASATGATGPAGPISRLPPMGWNSWNAVGLAVDERTVKAQAHALVASGMDRAGYRYVVLDGGWRAPRRNARGEMQANPAKFPDGIEAVAAYVHSLGLKFGLHQPIGPRR